MLHYATIGTGWIAESFITGALRHSGLVLHAVHSRSAERGTAFKNKHLDAGRGEEILVYTDLMDMAEDPMIDAVYIASPNKEHVRQSRLMLEHGKHVICEKPIAIDPEDLAALQQLAKEKGLIYMEAIMMLHQPHLAGLKEEIAKIGKIRTAHIDFSQYSSKYEAYQKYLKDPGNPLPNIFNPVMQTGALEDLGIYCVYFILELFGEPSSVSTFPLFMESGADAGGEVVFTYPDCSVSMTYSKVAQSFSGSEILGDQGTVHVLSCSKLDEMERRDTKGNILWSWGAENKEDLMGREAKDFEAYILHPEETKEDYERASEKAAAVCRMMAQIREKAGIVFPKEENNGI